MNTETFPNQAQPSDDHTSSRENRKNSDTEDNTDNTSILTRFLYTVLFLIIFGVVEAVLYLTTLVCIVTHLINKQPLPKAVEFGKALSVYVSKIVAYLTYNKVTPPWPFESLGSK